MSLVQKAQQDRYVVINPKKDSVIYLPQGKERRYSNPEEKVQLQTYLDLIYQYGYPPEKLRVCEKMQIGSSTREADIVVYKDREAKDPYIIVECKKRKVSQSVFQSAVDQGFSYAAVSNAEYVWATSGDRSAVYEVWHNKINEREANRLDRIPKHKEEGTFRFDLRRRFRWLLRHPILSDALLYAVVLLAAMIALSKLAVAYHPQIYKLTRSLWEKHNMDFNWIYNTLILLASLVGMLFGGIFMRSHQFFQTSGDRKRLTYVMIAIILIVPAWFVGENNHDPNWWKWLNYKKWLDRDWPMVVYLWPYLKAWPVQIGLISGLIWLMNRREKQ